MVRQHDTIFPIIANTYNVITHFSNNLVEMWLWLMCYIIVKCRGEMIRAGWHAEGGWVNSLTLQNSSWKVITMKVQENTSNNLMFQATTSYSWFFLYPMRFTLGIYLLKENGFWKKRKLWNKYSVKETLQLKFASKNGTINAKQEMSPEHRKKRDDDYKNVNFWDEAPCLYLVPFFLTCY